jgi:hypothetical protein
VRGNPLETPRDFLIPNAGINWIVHGRRRPLASSNPGAKPRIMFSAKDTLAKVDP